MTDIYYKKDTKILYLHFYKKNLLKILFHQNDSTGFLPFTEGEGITGGGGAATLEAAGVDADSDAFGVSTIKKTSGEILYIENRAPVTRAANQTEDIKVVITL